MLLQLTVRFPFKGTTLLNKCSTGIEDLEIKTANRWFSSKMLPWFHVQFSGLDFVREGQQDWLHTTCPTLCCRVARRIPSGTRAPYARRQRNRSKRPGEAFRPAVTLQVTVFSTATNPHWRGAVLNNMLGLKEEKRCFDLSYLLVKGRLWIKRVLRR